MSPFAMSCTMVKLKEMVRGLDSMLSKTIFDFGIGTSCRCVGVKKKNQFQIPGAPFKRDHATLQYQ